MGLLSREPSAPIADTETGSGAEVEAELSKLFNELNGGLDGTNFAAGADISGAKIATASIPGTALKANTLTTGEFSADGIPTTYVDQDTSSALLVASRVFATEGLSLSLVNLTVGDWILVRFCGIAETLSGNGGDQSIRSMSIDVDGTTHGDLSGTAIRAWLFPGGTAYHAFTIRSISLSYAFQATDTTHTVTLVSRIAVGTEGYFADEQWTGDTRTFTATVIPQKG